MRRRPLATAALVGVLLAAAPGHAGDATGAFAPYEDLIEVLADLTWHLKDDIYRFPPPRDPTGHDLYHLTLDRLGSWEKRFPGRLRDVTTFARAEALERLGEYAGAADAYRQVAAMASPLAERARDGAARATDFAAAAALPEDGPDVQARLAALKAKLEAWSKVIERFGGTPYEPLALVEEERLEEETAATIVAHRHLIDDGDATAERSLRFLIEKHAESKNLAAHILRLADLYADLAREYVAQHHRPLAFDEDDFRQRADRALEMYRKVATWDGSPEKPEGQGQFSAFDAWKTAVLARYR
ncbi:MAG TPA: hypothetical protein VKW76_02395 [Candidatus Binatia bacterium]|nr:hypothetical protein [Candidatus Binatia bacterium]